MQIPVLEDTPEKRQRVYGLSLKKRHILENLLFENFFKKSKDLKLDGVLRSRSGNFRKQRYGNTGIQVKFEEVI